MALDDTKWSPKTRIKETAGDVWVIEQMRCVPMPKKGTRLILIEIAAFEVINIIENMINWRKPE